MIPSMNPQVQFGVGVALIVFGLIYFYKAIVATVRGKVRYWQGFAPFTLVSPWIVVLPSSEKSLIKNAEGLWVTCIMAPLFFLSSFFCIIAGTEFCGWPGADLFNQACNGGKYGNSFVLFDKRQGFHFPFWDRSWPRLAKMFSTKVDKKHDDEFETNSGSLDDARNGS